MPSSHAANDMARLESFRFLCYKAPAGHRGCWTHQHIVWALFHRGELTRKLVFSFRDEHYF